MSEVAHDAADDDASSSTVLAARPERADLATAEGADVAVVTPLEASLVASMHQIVHGNVLLVPTFVRNLVQYFDAGTRPGMTPHELGEHLARKTSFVLGSLFRMPGAHDGADGAPTTPSRAPPSPPRWYDVAVGAFATTAAWRLAAIEVAVYAWGRVRTTPPSRRTVLSAAAVLLATNARASVSELSADAIMLWTVAQRGDRDESVLTYGAALACALGRVRAVV